jgi:hypothetical protein
LSAARLLLALVVVTIATACGDSPDVATPTSNAPSAAPSASATRGDSGIRAPASPTAAKTELEAEASPAQQPAPIAELALPPQPSEPAPSSPVTGTALHEAPRAAVTGSPTFARTVGTATIRFWSIFEERTGRERFEYHFHVTVQNGGGGLLRGAVMVTSSAAASHVAISCAPFGTTPPGTTRDADAPFVIAQDRSAPFDPAKLAFSIDATPDPALCQDPGRVTLRRLNRSEYDNTVRDLLGTAEQPALDFPADDFGYGFDTIGDVLALSPLLFEKAEAAARTLVEEALRIYPPASGQRNEAEAEATTHDCGGDAGDFWNLWSECGLSVQVTVAVPSSYEIRVRAYQTPAGSEAARLQLREGAVAVGGEIEVPATSSAPGIYTARKFLDVGTHTLHVEFTNDYYVDPADRNLLVDYVELYGPLDAVAPAPQIAALRALCNPAIDGTRPCLRERLEAFVRRAWRRPPSAAEIGTLVALAEATALGGADFEASLGAAMTAAMTSPHFLFRVERDPHPRSAEVHALSDHELATRLSYFLWSSMPDAALDQLADAGTLDVPATLAAQVHRMVLDAKARGFVDSFAGQWLGTRSLDDVNPDSIYFPAWDNALKQAMRDETHLVFQEFLQTQTDFLGFFDAKFTYLNDRLAQHYGLPAPGSSTPVRVTLAQGGQRSGIFTHGSILTVYAQPRRTSPVKRGKWALDQILCIDIQPPPAGVEGMLDAPGATGTLRERLAAHRAKPECATCHDYLDPIGLGLENYDAIGAFRTLDEGQPIDASGAFPDGRSFDGAAEMAALVKADPNTPHCVAERLLTYALGRGLEDGDGTHLDAITAAFQTNGRSFENLITAIVQSEPFRMRRGEANQ